MADAIQLNTAVSTELGSYRLGELLGEGGMGSVYRAEHRALRRKVAVKILNPSLARDPALVKRFFGEARVVNEINHQHIVEIHDFVEEADGRSYFVMELLDGKNLVAAREQDGPFGLARTLDIALQICSALKAAHDKGVIHRDIKPENVMLVERNGRRDFVKLLDFGVAKMPQSGIGPARTMAGMVFGTPEYMSPEQAGGRPVDARADIYSMGVLLYWMLCGRVPFEASGFDKLIVLRLTTPAPRLPAVGPGAERRPASLLRLVARCLERKPGERFQSMAEVSAALEGVVAELAAPAGRGRLRLLGAVGAVALALAIAGNWAAQLRPSDPMLRPSASARQPAKPASSGSLGANGVISRTPIPTATATPTQLRPSTSLGANGVQVPLAPSVVEGRVAVPTPAQAPLAPERSRGGEVEVRVSTSSPPPPPHKREPHRRGPARAARARDVTAIVNPYEE